MSTTSANNTNSTLLEKPEIFPGFARIWACATLIHQLAFTFWAMSWPGWVLVISAIAVLFKPACLHRFTWLVVASLINLFNKLPFVPNHILFEGMLHVTMLLAMVAFLFKKEGTAYIKRALQDGWKLRFLIGIVIIKAIYHLTPAIPKNPLLGSITTALLLLAIGLYLFGREPVKSGEIFIAKFAPVARISLMLMYFWAAIQKMNFDYLIADSKVSCAAKLHTDIARYFGELVPTKEWALHGAIWGSFFFEIMIPIFLMIPRTRLVGLLAAVWFHLWLSIHPAAGIFSFSSLILAMLYLFLPVGTWRELKSLFVAQLKKIGRGNIERGEKITTIAVVLFFLVILITQITLYTTSERSYAVFHKANRIGFIAFATWGLWLGSCYIIASFKSRGRDNQFPHRPTGTIAWAGLMLVFMNGLSPWIGGKTQTAFSMYSNLKSEGEGNHCFLKRVDLLPFQKDIVKVTASNPNILEPSSKPKGIGNFANIGNNVMPFFELRRLITTHPETEGDFELTYEHQGEMKKISRTGDVVTGDENLLKPIPLLARKFIWFRRLDSLEGTMTCTH